jgi:L-alanine-DL-glutamate epimerase-like enolase superfamily enzyme
VLSDSTHGDIAHFELVTARVRAADGAEGTGYTYTVGAGAGAIRVLLEELAALLLGRDPEEIEALWQRLWWGCHYVGRGGLAAFAIAAADIALWDLRARRAGLPLWKLLGGHHPRVKAYAGGIDLQFPLDRLLRQTDDNIGRGFRAIKMKVGRPRLSEDVERVRAMREHLGAGVPLMVDANMRWTADEAIRAARAFAAHDVFWLEEPTIPDDVPGHVRIVREGGLPVAAGENLRTIHEFKRLIDAGGVTFPEPDVSNVGGITPWIKVAHVAEAHNLPVTSHGVHDLHVHLLAAVPNASYLEVHGFGLERFMAQPLVIRDGEATAPDRPGHGVEFDWKELERVRAKA